MARTVAAVERLKTSAGDSASLIETSDQRRLDAALGHLGAEAALVVLGHRGTLDLVALVQEGDPEGEGDVLEDLGVLGPGDDRARRHHRRDVAVDEAGAREVG